MRTTSVIPTLALLALVTVPGAAQETGPHGEHEGGLSPTHEMLSPHTRELGRSVEQLRGQIHQTNRWMIVHGAPEGLHGVGTEMAHAGEHLQELVRRLDEAYGEPSTAPADRKNVDALTAQVRRLEGELVRTLAALRRAVGYQ